MPAPSSSTTDVPSNDGLTQSSLDALLQDQMTADAAGLLLAVSSPSRDLDVRSGVGVADTDTKSPISPDGTFRIASVTKTFTSATILRLYEEGKLDLEDPLSSTGVSSAVLDVLRGDGYDVDAINIRQLLNHTSGIADYLDSEGGTADGAFNAEITNDPTRSWTALEQIMFATEQYEPVSRPGVEFHYSDTGYVILGQIIEAKTGLTYAEAMRTLLNFDELNMDSTFVELVEQPGPSAGPRVTQYAGDVRVNDLSATIDLFGGGGLVSSTHDLTVFFGALADGRVFRFNDTFTLMTEITAPGTESVEGMGIYSTEVVAGQRCWTHSGFWGVEAYTCPSLDLSVALSTTQAAVRVDSQTLLTKIVSLVSPALPQDPITATPESAERALQRQVTLTSDVCPEGMPEGATCGLAAVPLDWTSTSGETIDVWFGLIKATTGTATSTVIPIHGGPGLSITGVLGEFVPISLLTPDYDVLLIDHRGTGKSTALDCAFPDTSALLEGDDLRAAIANCGQEIGPKRAFYNTVSAAYDIEAIRRALELANPRLLGYSYGTLVGSAYATLFPETVEAVVLDGALPFVVTPLGRQQIAAIEPAIRTVCDQSSRCDSDEVVTAYRSFAASLKDTPITIPGTDFKLTETQFLQIFGGAAQQADPNMLNDVVKLANGDMSPLTALATLIEPEPAVAEGSENPQSEFYWAAVYTVFCSSVNNPFDMTVPPDQRVDDFTELLAAMPEDFARPFSLDALMKTAGPFTGGCLRWPATDVPAELMMPIHVSSPTMPVLVINGDLDLQTSLNGAFQAASQFTNSVMVKVPNAPHVVMRAVPCIRDVAATFLNDAVLPPADTCTDQVVPIP
jgi:D-alanyl-D-alanine carboxypeptidase